MPRLGSRVRIPSPAPECLGPARRHGWRIVPKTWVTIHRGSARRELQQRCWQRWRRGAGKGARRAPKVSQISTRPMRRAKVDGDGRCHRSTIDPAKGPQSSVPDPVWGPQIVRLGSLDSPRGLLARASLACFGVGKHRTANDDCLRLYLVDHLNVGLVD